MERTLWVLGTVAVAGTTFALAQPPGPDGPPEMRRPSPIVEALDADHDGRISADELKNAAAALATLDKNKDGELTEDEYRPQGVRGGGRPGAGPRDGDGPPDRRGGPPEDRGPEDRGPGRRGPGDFDRPAPGGPDGRGDRGPEPRGRGQRGPGPGDRRPDRPEPDGRGPEGRGPDGPPPEDGPDPDRMFSHAMEFDADDDGKLNRVELKKFIADFIARRPGPGGQGAGPGRVGPPGGNRQGGRGPQGGPGAGRPDDGGDRPERPRRPD